MALINLGRIEPETSSFFLRREKFTQPSRKTSTKFVVVDVHVDVVVDGFENKTFPGVLFAHPATFWPRLPGLACSISESGFDLLKVGAAPRCRFRVVKQLRVILYRIDHRLYVFWFGLVN